MAEGVGFEPTEPAKARQFSRLVFSTTQPPLRQGLLLDKTNRNFCGLNFRPYQKNTSESCFFMTIILLFLLFKLESELFANYFSTTKIWF